MPDHHNPTGLVMPDRERAAYARLLAKHGATAVVDEAHHALRLDGAPRAAPVRVVRQGRDHRRQRQQERLGRPPARLDPRAARTWSTS